MDGKSNIDNTLKVLFKAVIPEVPNRESILFKNLPRFWITDFAGLSIFYKFINV